MHEDGLGVAQRRVAPILCRAVGRKSPREEVMFYLNIKGKVRVLQETEEGGERKKKHPRWRE